MSDSREIKVVRIQIGGQSYPKSWQGWIASLIVGIFAVAMIVLIAVLASAVFVVALVLFAVAAALVILRLIFSPADIARGFREFRKNRNA
jgi:cation transporter-like permease